MARRAHPTMFVFLAVVLLVWTLGHAYVAWRWSAPLSPPWSRLVVAAVAAAAVLWPVTTLATRTAPAVASGAALVRSVSWLYFGLFTVAVVLTAARDVAVLALGTVARGVFNPERRALLDTAATSAVIALTGGVGVAGWVGATRIAPVVRVEVPIPGLDTRLDGLRIAQVSDIHIGQPLTRDELAAIVDRTNAIGADLIAVTGDLVDGRASVFADDIAPIEHLSAPLGVFFVTGNHEYYSGAKEWERLIAARGLTVLTNEHRVVRHNGAAVTVAGVTDYSAGAFAPADASDPARALAGSPAESLRLLLAHQPRSAVAAAAAGAQLQLSGHTHGGQYWPFTTIIDWFHPVPSGLSRLGELAVYVSRGTGVWGPRLRVGAPNEITELVLRAA